MKNFLARSVPLMIIASLVLGSCGAASNQDPKATVTLLESGSSASQLKPTILPPLEDLLIGVRTSPPDFFGSDRNILDNEQSSKRDAAAVAALPPEDKAFYHKHAGLYLLRGETPESLSKQLLQLAGDTWDWYSWGLDLPAAHYLPGIIDYSSSAGDFTYQSGNGGEVPFKLLAANGQPVDNTNPFPDGILISSPARPQFMLKDLLASNSAARKLHAPGFPSPEAAYDLVKNLYPEVLKALCTYRESELLPFISKSGLYIDTITPWIKDFRYSLEELSTLTAKSQPQAYLGSTDLHLMLSEMFSGRYSFELYPNVFINEDAAYLAKNYPGSIALEFRFASPDKDRQTDYQWTGDTLDLVFIQEGPEWKLAKLAIFAYLY